MNIITKNVQTYGELGIPSVLGKDVTYEVRFSSHEFDGFIRCRTNLDRKRAIEAIKSLEGEGARIDIFDY